MSSIPPASTLVPGQLLDRYELLAPVAQGGMAQVWVARLQGKLGFERLVAVKTVVAALASDQRFEHMFLDEARIIAAIRHPNVAQILDLGDTSGVLYLVLEWIDGDSVAALRRAVHSKSEKMPLGIILRIMAETCAGLHAAHELKNADGKPLDVVHRDVSPSNVLLSTSGEVKVIDFGVAKAVDRVGAETAAGVIKGKVAYMSPEQALGKKVDRRSDVWAAGVMLYHLLAGRTPYEAENQIATLHRVVQGLPPEPIRGIPDEIGEIVYTALSYAPEGRFATADEMQRVVESTLVKTCGATTQADVAGYLNSKLAERITRRKRVIQRALDAAEQRRQLAVEFETAIEQSSSSMYMVRELKTPSTMSAANSTSASGGEAVDALLGTSPDAGRSEQATERPLPPVPIPPSPAPEPESSPRAAPSERPLPPIPVPPERPRSAAPPPPEAPTEPAPSRPRSVAPPAIDPLRPRSAPPPLPKSGPSSAPAASAAAVPKFPGPARVPVISEASDVPSPRAYSLPDGSAAFGTRRRGPLIAVGFALALLLLGYGAYLAWDKVNTEREMAPAPSAR